MGFQEALLNDSNPHIIRLYRAIQEGSITPASVKTYLQREGALLSAAGDNGYDHFRLVRDRFNADFSPLDLLFLSRSGFNGMMRFSKKGRWNIPFCKKPQRFSQAYITKIVNQVAAVQRVARPQWEFATGSFSEIIPQAVAGDIIYCDPPYFGRYVDYYNGWTEADEELLFHQLSETPAHFILSTWHHNTHRSNTMIDTYWGRFNIITRDHFYHSGGKLENRQPVVEALVFNFPVPGHIETHNHEQPSAQMAMEI